MVVFYVYIFIHTVPEKRGGKKQNRREKKRKKNGVNNGDGNELLRERGTLTSGRHNIVVIVLVVSVDIMYGMSDKKS